MNIPLQKFNVGDRVRCIKPDLNKFLVDGTIYIIDAIDDTAHLVQVKECWWAGIAATWFSTIRFELVLKEKTMFKVGDIVKCVDAGANSSLTTGYHYLVNDVFEDEIAISARWSFVGLSGSAFSGWYFSNRFDLVTDSLARAAMEAFQQAVAGIDPTTLKPIVDYPNMIMKKIHSLVNDPFYKQENESFFHKLPGIKPLIELLSENGYDIEFTKRVYVDVELKKKA